MIYNYYPWKIEVDVDKTKKIYEENNFCVNKCVNAQFISYLNKKQISFFKDLGVDVEKINVSCNQLDGLKVYESKFIISGKLLSLTNFQAEIYSDVELFGPSIYKYVETIDMKDLGLDNGIDDMIVSFKHPISFYKNKIFKEWNCGYVLVFVILKVSDKDERGIF